MKIALAPYTLVAVTSPRGIQTVHRGVPRTSRASSDDLVMPCGEKARITASGQFRHVRDCLTENARYCTTCWRGGLK